MKFSLTRTAMWLDVQFARSDRFTVCRIILELFMVMLQLFRHREVAQYATAHRENGVLIVTAKIDGRTHILRANLILSDYLMIAHDPNVPNSGTALYVETGIEYI